MRTSAVRIFSSWLFSGTPRWLTDVTVVGDTIYAVGYQGAVLASTNMIDWTYIGTTTEKSLFGASAYDGQLIAVGVEGAILRAQVIPDLTPVEFVDYSRQDDREIFLMAGVPGQRFSVDSTSAFTNWVAGPTFEFLDSSGTLLFFQGLSSNAPPHRFHRAVLRP